MPTTESKAEDPEHQPELRTENEKDDSLPDGVENAEPEDEEMNVREEGEAVAGCPLVDTYRDEGEPRQAKGHNEDKGHDMARVRKVLREGCRVLLIVNGGAASHPPHHSEDVGVCVDDGDDGRTQDENCESRRVGRHVFPVEETDQGVSVEAGLVEA